MVHLKIVNAGQGHTHQYENTKRKLYSCIANIYFNRQCLQKTLIPHYANIKIPNSSPAAKFTQRIAQTLRINDELKYLYMKKQQLNHKLYLLILSLANTWGNSQHYIQCVIEDKMPRKIQSKYKTLDNKLHKLSREQLITPKDHHKFYPGILNNMDITFSANERALLNKGPKYNLHSKNKHWFTNLALEVESAITLLPMIGRE